MPPFLAPVEENTLSVSRVSRQDDGEVVAIACSLNWPVYRRTAGEHFKIRTSQFSKCKLYCFDDWKVALLQVCVEATLSLVFMKGRGRSEEDY